VVYWSAVEHFVGRIWWSAGELLNIGRIWWSAGELLNILLDEFGGLLEIC
jgi:hypothetical protein